MHTILVVDDEKNMLSVLSILFESKGYTVLSADNGAAGLDLFDKHPEIDLIISDMKMPEMDGIAFMQEIRLRSQEVPFILISAHGTIDRAVEAMKLGATDFITKPFNTELILHTVNKVWSFDRMKKENVGLKENQKEHRMVFRSPEMGAIMQTLERVAKFPTPILLTGESGSGKEVVARAIHTIYQGLERKPFISINCPAVPESLLESELFGYRKGAFTGADADFPGKIRLAQGGTLFLDEIGDLPLAIQPKLLRLLEHKTIEPLGLGKTITIDTRIICATNKNLTELVAAGEFRGDLLYRINTFHVEIPPLRERTEDIEPLLEFFLDKYSSELNLGDKQFSRKALRVLQSYSWPGNVRELRNLVERTAILSPGPEIGVESFPEIMRKTKLRRTPQNRSAVIISGNSENLTDIERNLLMDALESNLGNISAAARALGITRNTMRYRLKKHSIALPNETDE